MKKISFILIVIFTYFTSITSSLAQQTYAPNGGCFTPKDTLRAIVLFVGFGPAIDTLPGNWINGWDNEFPDFTQNNGFFYSDVTDFDNPIAASDSMNISRWYYEMSNHKFKFMADYYRVDLDSVTVNSIRNINALGAKAWEKFAEENPNFDWQKYDSRTNQPGFHSDNSDYAPDGEIDYAVIIYKRKPGMVGMPPYMDLTLYYTAVAGITWTPIITGIPLSFSTGFTQVRVSNTGSKAGCFGLFAHEVAHSLYNAPHYGGANGVVGSYFYGQGAGWGTMNFEISSAGNVPFRTINAWERWYLGWSEITAGLTTTTQIPSKLTFPLANDSVVFILRDFVKYSDAVCIEIPSDTLGGKQRLWLEHHGCDSLYFDTRDFRTIGNTPITPRSSSGLYAYIEAITDSRNDTSIFDIGANAIKYLHAQGSYDYEWTGTSIPNHYWGNTTYPFNEKSANPYSGQSRWEKIRFDKDRNNSIYHDHDPNSPYPNEQAPIIMRNGVVTCDWAGINANFKPGKRLGIATNPALINYPKFAQGASGGFEPTILNGIEVKVMSSPLAHSRVEVKRNKVDIDTNFRMAAKDIVLMNITNWNGTDNLPDLVVKSNKTLLLNRSKSVSKTVKRGDLWSDPTTLSCRNNSIIKVEPHAQLVLVDSSTLELREGTKLIVEDSGVVYVECGSKIDTVSNLNIVRLGTGKVIFQNCNYIEEDSLDEGEPPVEPYIPDTTYFEEILCVDSTGLPTKDILYAPDSSYLWNATWYITNPDTTISIQQKHWDSLLAENCNTQERQDTLNLANILTGCFHDVFAKSDSLNVHLVLEDGETFVWNIKANRLKDQIQLSEIIKKDSLHLPANFIFSKYGTSATIELHDTSSKQQIELPGLGNKCGYSIDCDADSSAFITYPFIANYDNLIFELNPHYCATVSLTLSSDCSNFYCSDNFVIHLKNTDCLTPAACQWVDIEFTHDTKADENPLALVYGKTSNHSLSYIVKTTDSNATITSIDATILESSDTNIAIKGIDIKPTSSDSSNYVVYFERCKNEIVDITYQICTTIDNDVVCCDTLTFNDTCTCINSHELYVDVREHLDFIHISYIIKGDWPGIPPPPFTIDIHDFFGNQIERILDKTQPAIEGKLTYNTKKLVAGVYLAVFRLGDQIKTVSFIVN